METRMSRWGVGPRITAAILAAWAVGGAATYTWPDACLMQFLPGVVFRWAGAVLLIIGVPMWLVAAVAVMRAYNRDELVTSGMFAIVRHPMYSAWIVWNLPGIALLTRSWPLLLVPLVAYGVFKALIHREEDYLERRFGQAYAAYRVRVNQVIPCPRFGHGPVQRASAARR